MNNKEENKIDKAAIIDSFEKILEEIDELDDWTFSNAVKLDKLNNRRHYYAEEMIELGLESGTSLAYGTDETNREISIAQDTRPKKKKDADFNERQYYRGIGHLKDEINTYISKLVESISKENN